MDRKEWERLNIMMGDPPPPPATTDELEDRLIGLKIQIEDAMRDLKVGFGIAGALLAYIAYRVS